MPEETVIIEKSAERIAEDTAILTHCIVDPQEWVDRAIANNMQWAIQAKIEEYRQDYLNAKYLSVTVDPETGIDTRVENPDYLNRAERDALEELKRDPLYGKTPSEILQIKASQMVQAVQSMLDTTARTRNYDGILSACTYATSTNTTFAAEGQACVAWRDAVWSKCYEIMNDVQNQIRPEPTLEILLSELPALNW